MIAAASASSDISIIRREISRNIDLSGKTTLVTGSTAGIGHAIAKGLAVTGAKVRGVAADVSTAEGCKALLAALPRGIVQTTA